MKKGYEYVTSFEKRSFDVAFASLLMPVKKVGEVAVGYLVRHSSGHDISPILTQDRVGIQRVPFTIEKFVTLYPGTNAPIARWAATLRRLGLDELAQVANIHEGTMSFTGPRPLICAEYETTRESLHPRLRQQWDEVIGSSRPGLYSSYGIHSHTLGEDDPNGADIRAEMDIKDFYEASVTHDIALTAEFMGVAVARRLK